MKVIELHAENFKRLKAITIRPEDDSAVVISGKNAQGKSSAIDAIWAALQGVLILKNTPEPVRKGKKEAEVRVDLGDYIVTRKWKKGGKNSYLTVTTPDGAAKITSPQKLLDSLMGELSFDPLAFTRLTDKNQTHVLMSMLRLDITKHEDDRATAYEERTIVNRDAEKAKVQMDTIPEIEDVPDAIDVNDLMEQYQLAVDESSEIQHGRDMIDEAEKELTQLKDRMKELTEIVYEWQKQLSSPRKHPDSDEIKKKIDSASEINAIVEQADARKEFENEYTRLLNESKSLTQSIENVDAAKQEMLNSVKMPIEGLSINDERELEINGIPLKQASRSEQLQVAIAIGMSQNPELRVMRVEDASVLDDESMQALTTAAQENDYQLWMEIVDGSGEIGICIEDGEIINEGR